MIALDRVSKTYETGRGVRVALDNASCLFERSKSIAIIGEDAEAKALLLNLLSGKVRPSAGRVRRMGRIFTGASRLQGSLTGVENAKFACRIYGMDLQPVMDYIARFTKLGSALDAPLATYSMEMKTRFSVGLNLALRFDTYLLNVQSSTLDARFLKSAAPAFEGPNRRSLILVASSKGTMRRFCSHGVVLRNGKLGEIEPIEEALSLTA